MVSNLLNGDPLETAYDWFDSYRQDPSDDMHTHYHALKEMLKITP